MRPPLPRLAIGLLLLFAFLSPAEKTVAQSTPASPKDTLTVEKALSRFSPGMPVISPDGSKAIVTVTQTGVGPDLPATHLWLLDIPTKKVRQFTNSAKSENNPKWSPDGQTLAFSSGRTGTTQIFLISLHGGEALPLTKSKTDIGQFEWAPDGKTIAYTTQDEIADSIKKRQADKFDEKVVSESEHASRLYTIDIETKKTHQWTHQNWSIDEMKWMPGAKDLLMVVNELPMAEIQSPKLLQFSLTDSSVKMLAAPGHEFWGNVLVSPDGSTAAFTSARIDGPISHDLFVHRLHDNTYANITDKKLDRAVLHYVYTDNHTLLALVQQGFDNHLSIINDNGDVTPYP